MDLTPRFQQILGVRFFVGDAQGAIEEVSQRGGLVVVPSAPTLKNLASDKGYREALLGADFAIADSAFMVLLWNLIDRIPQQNHESAVGDCEVRSKQSLAIALVDGQILERWGRRHYDQAATLRNLFDRPLGVSDKKPNAQYLLEPWN